MSSAPTSGRLVAGRVSDGGHWRLSRPSTNVVISGGPSAAGTGGTMPSSAAPSSTLIAPGGSVGGEMVDVIVDEMMDEDGLGEMDEVDGAGEGTGARVVSLVRMATPPMPSRSAIARRARGLATSTTPTITIAAAASARTRRTAGRWTNGVTTAGRSSSATTRSGRSDAPGNSRLSASSARARSRSTRSMLMGALPRRLRHRVAFGGGPAPGRAGTSPCPLGRRARRRSPLRSVRRSSAAR